MNNKPLEVIIFIIGVFVGVFAISGILISCWHYEVNSLKREAIDFGYATYQVKLKNNEPIPVFVWNHIKQNTNKVNIDILEKP